MHNTRYTQLPSLQMCNLRRCLTYKRLDVGTKAVVASRCMLSSIVFRHKHSAGNFLDLVMSLQFLGLQSVVDRKPCVLERMLTQVLSV